MGHVSSSLDDTVHVHPEDTAFENAAIEDTVIVCEAASDRISDGEFLLGKDQLEELQSELLAALDHRVRELTLETIGQELVVSGVVPSFHFKQRINSELIPRIAGYRLTNAVSVVRSK